MPQVIEPMPAPTVDEVPAVIEQQPAAGGEAAVAAAAAGAATPAPANDVRSRQIEVQIWYVEFITSD